MTLSTLFAAFTWAALAFAATAGLAFVAMPLVLGRAQDAIRSNPPAGPDWARRIWFSRENVYLGIVSVALLVAAVAFVLGLL